MKIKMYHSLVLGTLLSCSNAPKADCIEKPFTGSCLEIYQPVCGCNNQTYPNNCMANAVGIRVVAEGECPSK